MTEKTIPQALVILIGEFAASVEIPELAFDSAGLARLRFGDSIDVVLAAAPGGLTLSCDLGTLPEGRDLERRALEASFLKEGAGESWLGLDPERHLHLLRRLPLDGLDLPSFEAALAAFFEDIAQWRALLLSSIRLPGLAPADPQALVNLA